MKELNEILKNKICIDNIMTYIRNLSSRINKADACGGGMKKAGLVYGSDWPRIPGRILSTKTPSNIVFGLRGVSCSCGQKATTNLHSSSHAMKHTNTSMNR